MVTSQDFAGQKISQPGLFSQELNLWRGLKWKRERSAMKPGLLWTMSRWFTWVSKRTN